MELSQQGQKKQKYFLKAKTSKLLENISGKPLNIVCLTTICNFEASC